MIGTFNKRIRLQYLKEIPDGMGGVKSEWHDLLSMPNTYAAIAFISSADAFRAHSLDQDISHSIVVRFRDDLKTGMRIIASDDIYIIKSMSDMNGKAKYLEILATKENSNV